MIMNFLLFKLFKFGLFSYLQPKESSLILMGKETDATLKLWNFVNVPGNKFVVFMKYLKYIYE